MSILLLVFLIPVSAVFVLKEVEKTLVENLKQNIALTSELVSQQLEVNADWFGESLLPDSQNFIAKELFVFPLSESILLDGFFDEWYVLETYRKSFQQPKTALDKNNSLALLLAESEEALYLSVAVKDQQVIYPNSNNKNKSDRIIINFLDSQNNYRQIIISPRAPGKIPVKQLLNDKLRIDWRFNATWTEVAGGFNLELKFPSGITPKQLNLIHEDVDEKNYTGSVVFVGTDRFDLSPVVWPSAALTDFTKKLKVHAGQRLWVLDTHGRALANKDNLSAIDDFAQTSSFMSWVLGVKPKTLKDKRANRLQLDSHVIYDALQGETSIAIESTVEGEYSVVLAASPIMEDGKPIGVVFVEENIAKVQLLQQKTLAQMVYLTGTIVLSIILILVWYISRLTLRIGKLKRQVIQVVDEHGRMNSSLKLEYIDGDEVDDLNNAFLDMGNRLYEYNDYLEKLASRLSHELRTPIAIVRSSLDNLLHNAVHQDKEVIERAISGTERLGEILTRMRRATGIKQAMQTADIETIDLVAMIRMLVSGFQSSFANHQFKFVSNVEILEREISGELVAEMLDKLVSNAMDFSVEDKPITVELNKSDKALCLSVENFGKTIPKKNIRKIFQSLVSLREEKSKDSPNLGLGLYVVKLIAEFHGAKVNAVNLNDGSQDSKVRFEITWNDN